MLIAIVLGVLGVIVVIGGIIVGLSMSPWWMGVDDGICHSCDQVKGRGYCAPCLEETE